ncbi:MAG: AbrB/MazE/SpoVT family DNA-binding domain-containing protein [Eubacteriales bacterium]|nr:AbrB/MazE/SpoVT family DNA-binding domain-containing protein [Eubacteriales bacterium]MDD4323736.1 AbrB/MazE/SpoVT family DNA-binding domain-containing protein [Eubacteriales bacterium]MDD4541551.1 AbrB/MazE/SpoVT family DNA-binding domain-containing protein [Eubacteriales bacterium]
MKKVKTSIYKSGNSQAITLQKSILEEANLKVGDEIDYYVDEVGRIILEKSGDSFEQRWALFVKEDGSYDEEEMDWGEPVGRERW